MNKTLKFLVVFLLILLLLSVGGVLVNVVGAILGTAFGILGLVLKLIFSKSVLTLIAVGAVAYIIVNHSTSQRVSKR